MTPAEVAAVTARLDQMAAEVRDLSERLEPLEAWVDGVANCAAENITRDMEAQLR